MTDMTMSYAAQEKLDALEDRLGYLERIVEASQLGDYLPIVEFRGSPPFKAHSTDAGYDLRAAEDRYLPVGGRVAVRTGTWAHIPEGVYGMMCSRSGLALKEGVIVANAPGIIDAGYEGELLVTLVNLSDRPYRVQEGQRVAQLVLARYDGVGVRGTVLPHTATPRGTGGHGSSGN